MNAIRTVFPLSSHLLCVWHINKNVMAHCRPTFANTEVWEEFQAHLSQLFRSQTTGAFEEAWNVFRARFGLDYSAVQYIESSWIPHKECFVSAWANELMHLDNTSTSKAEGSHPVLKKYLQTSTGDLKTMVERCSMAIVEQKIVHDHDLGFETANLPHIFSHPIYAEVVCKVSQYCLGRIDKHLKFALQARRGVQRPPCTEAFQRTMGFHVSISYWPF